MDARPITLHHEMYAFIIIRIGSLLQAAAVLTTSVLKSNLLSDYIDHPMALQSRQSLQGRESISSASDH